MRLRRRTSEPALDPPASGAPERFEFFDFVREQQGRRTRPGDVPRVLGRALALTYRAAPRLLVALVVLAVVGAALTALQVVLAKHVLQVLLAVSDNRRSVTSALRPVGAIVVVGAAATMTGTFSAQVSRLLSELVQRSVFRNVIDVCGAVDLEAFEDPLFFDQLQRVQTNALSQPVAVATGIINLVRGAVGALTLGAILVAILPASIPLLLIAAVPLSIASRRAGRTEFAFSIEQAPDFRRRAYLQGVLTDRPGAKEVRAFGLGPVLAERWERLYSRYYTGLKRQVRLRVLYAFAGRAAAAILVGLAFILLLHELSRHHVSLAEAGAAVFAIGLLSARVEALSSGGSGLFQSSLFLADLEAFLALGPRYRARRASAPAPRGFEQLTVEGLSFSYPASEALVLDDVDLVINRGEVVALVGENGSGKTTLAKLLGNLFTPTAGTIRWDGHDLRDFDPASVRGAIAVIFQDFIAYALSAAENIGVGRPSAIDDRDAIIGAAKQSGADAFIRRLPEGYDNFLSKAFDKGQDLSRGQWQRVALARAYYRDAPFVILDEPSSALDPRAEHELFSTIRTFLTDRTVLLISHRFSSVRSADRIYVMADGRIAEHGTHEELMALGGRYAELFTLQARAYLDVDPDA